MSFLFPSKLPIVDQSMPEVAIAGVAASNHKERKEHSQPGHLNPARCSPQQDVASS